MREPDNDQEVAWDPPPPAGGTFELLLGLIFAPSIALLLGLTLISLSTLDGWAGVAVGERGAHFGDDAEGNYRRRVRS